MIRKEQKKAFTPNFYFTLSFEYTFEDSNDEIYFAHSIPYTYSMLMKHLHHLEELPHAHKILTRQCLTTTLAGNWCEVLTITNKTENKRNIKRRGVFISARVHPGETGASWIMEGILTYLMSDLPEVAELWDSFVFKIIPMLNPDGVIHGNYRCSLVGCDLNRRWRHPS